MIIDYFQQLTQISHCSSHSEALKKFLIDFAKNRGYDIVTDETGNILASKGNPVLCLQAHYDMVCVGNAPLIKTEISDGWMSAKDASLGADNGMAIAMMMALMDDEKACEYLFTADEEIGLIGANALKFPLKSEYMLNLDSEDEGEVYIGCAGGVDIFAQKEYQQIPCEKPFYRLRISGLPGGHSGVEIHKNIPNAIKLFGEYCQNKDVSIVSINGGERINSIPVYLEAVIATDAVLDLAPYITLEKMENKYDVIADSAEIISLINDFKHGVLSWNKRLEIPDMSINLATISLEKGICKIAASARAMDEEGLKSVEKETKNFLDKYAYFVRSEGKYPAWKPEINDFSTLVCEEVEKVFDTCAYKAIHAGLECAVVSNLYPQIKIASIGPNIRSPHSTSEKVELASVSKVYEVVCKVIERINHAV